MGSIASYTTDLYRYNRSYLLRRYRRRKAFRNRDESFFQGLPDSVFETAPCIFVLSTGRCGTLLLTRLLDQCSNIDVYHKPDPELVYPSKRAFSEGIQKTDAYETAVIAARYDLIENSYLIGRIFIETNCRITFFAPYLASVFQNSKFIHLVRHPAKFVRSALGRGYYQNPRADRGHIVPVTAAESKLWNSIDLIQKITWNWNMTNSFIEEFKRNLPKERMMTVKAEEMFKNVSVIEKLIKFCGAEAWSRFKLKKILKKPVNATPSNKKKKMYKLDSITANADELKQIRRLALLSEKYGYQL